MCKIEVICQTCNSKFQKYKKDCKKTKLNFCSMKCYGINVKKRNLERKKKVYYCIKCNCELGFGYKFYKKKCEKCRCNYINHNVNWKEITFKSLKDKYQTFQAHAKIRGLARTIYKKSEKPKFCNKCSYDKHYEVCHIKPISSFPDDATISEINSLDNLLALCPNCHWEFDNL